MLYRALESLYLLKSGRRIPAGAVLPLRGIPPKTIQTLLEKVRIAEVHGPPLRIIPGWADREVEGIEMVVDAICADPKVLADALDMTVEEAEREQSDLLIYLQPPTRSREEDREQEAILGYPLGTIRKVGLPDLEEFDGFAELEQ